MTVACYVTVGFEDASTSVAERRYALLNDYADNGSDWDTAVTDAATLITGLDVLTMDHIKYHKLEFDIIDGGAAANVAANNNVEAFSRMHIVANGKPTHFSVPAWDDVTFAKAKNGLLSAAYQTAANVVGALIRDPQTLSVWAPDFSQSRGIKRGQRLVK